MQLICKIFVIAVVHFAASPVWALDDQQQRLPGRHTKEGSYYIEYIAPNPIPLNSIFSIRFRVLDAEDKRTIVKGVKLVVQPWMPDHNHGAAIEPRFFKLSDGTIEGQGFLLHMEGLWQLRAYATKGRKTEHAVFDINLEP